MNLSARIFKVTGGNKKIKANVSLVIDDMIVIKDIKIIEGKNGLFVSMPSRAKLTGGEVEKEDGKPVYLDIVHATSKDAQKEIEKVIMDAYLSAE